MGRDGDFLPDTGMSASTFWRMSYAASDAVCKRERVETPECRYFWQEIPTYLAATSRV